MGVHRPWFYPFITDEVWRKCTENGTWNEKAEYGKCIPDHIKEVVPDWIGTEEQLQVIIKPSALMLISVWILLPEQQKVCFKKN